MYLDDRDRETDRWRDRDRKKCPDLESNLRSKGMIAAKHAAAEPAQGPDGEKIDRSRK